MSKKLRYLLSLGSILACPIIVMAQFTWISIPSPTANNLYGVSFADSLVGTSVGAHGTIMRTTDGGFHWIIQSSGIPNALRNVFQVNTDTALAVGDSAVILRTTNGGTTWVTVFGAQNIVLNDIVMIDPDTGIAVGAGIYRTTTGGVTWESQTVPLAAYYTGIAFEDMNVGIAVTPSGHVVKTSDAGKTWTDSNLVGSFQFAGVASAKPNVYTAVGSVSQSGVTLFSSDGGLNWAVSHIAYLQRYIQDVYFVDLNFGICVGRKGTILVTSDAGQSWDQGAIDSSINLWGVSMNSKESGFAVGDGGEIIRVSLTGVMSVEDGGSRPDHVYLLTQNYPNPFNSQTSIEYRVLNTERLILTIYNSLGQRVATLVDEVKPTGWYKASWDASNEPSGVYFCKLMSHSFTTTTKIVLSK